MIITRTPFRVSLFGGGSDYPAWYRENGGAVLGYAIDKYCYISLRELPPFFKHKHRIVYSRSELVNELEEIEHPAVRAVLMDRGVQVGLEVHHDGDLPARSGLGSSSSFTVGLLHALAALDGRMVSKRHLAAEAIRIEQDVIGENVGSQDQVWAAHGGINRIDFAPDGTIDVAPVILTPGRRKELVSSSMLFFTGVSRIASEIAGKQIANLQNRAGHIRRMTEMVDEGLAILTGPGRPISQLGTLLHQSWMLKRELADDVTTAHVDEIYDAARAAGASGGKLLGAGGGGFMLFIVPPDKKAAVRQRLSSLIHVAFGIDTSGSKIVVFEPDGLENR